MMLEGGRQRVIQRLNVYTVRIVATYMKYRMPSLRTSEVKDISTLIRCAKRTVPQVLIQVTTMTMASERIMHDRVATDPTYQRYFSIQATPR